MSAFVKSIYFDFLWLFIKIQGTLPSISNKIQTNFYQSFNHANFVVLSFYSYIGRLMGSEGKIVYTCARNYQCYDKHSTQLTTDSHKSSLNLVVYGIVSL